MVPGGAAPLPVDAHHPGGHQAGPARGQGHHREAQGQEAGAHHLPTGPRHVQRDQRGALPRVLGAHAEGAQERVRRGHPRRAVPRAAHQAEAEVHAAVKVAISTQIRLGPSSQCKKHSFPPRTDHLPSRGLHENVCCKIWTAI